MSEFSELANKIMANPQRLVMSDAFRLVVTRNEREMIVAALRGADALRALADLPPQVKVAVSSQPERGK